MGARPRVLVVDDELGVRESLRAVLTPEFEVATAPSGESALDLMARSAFDVVTVDLRMPGVSGLDVLERAKRIDPDLEILIVTGYASFDSALEGLRQRAFDYVTKPFEPGRVRELVRRAAACRATAKLVRATPAAMLAEVSPDFRTPLNVILGYATMLRQVAGDDGADTPRTALDRVEANSAALLRQVEMLFYLLELDRGMAPVVSAEVQVAALLAGVCEGLREQAGRKGVRLSVEADPSMMLTTDEDKLTRLVEVLADNAVRYTRAGRVVLAARPVPGGVALEVHDTGPGLPHDVLAVARGVASTRGEQVVAGRALAPGFGLRVAGRLVVLIGGALSIDTSSDGTSVRVAVPDLASDD